MPEYNEKVEIELIKKDVTVITRLLEKYDTTIQKIQDVAIDLSRIVSVQEQRLQAIERTHQDDDQAMQNYKRETAEDFKEVNDKIQKVKSELTDKIEQTETSILNEIRKIKTDIEEINSDLSKKITSIEAWRYGVMGAIALGVFLLSKLIDVAKLFN